MGRVINRGPSKRELSFWGLSPTDMVSQRTASRTNMKTVNTANDALGISAVWAAIRLRADLVSTLPVETYRVVDNMRIDTGTTPFISSSDFMEFLYSSQAELDMTGNAIGIIQGVYPKTTIPAEIDLVPTNCCQVLMTGNKIRKYRINGEEYEPDLIWHEKQFTRAGLHVGMSPVEHAAYTLGQYVSIQEFATEWFAAGNGPRVSLRNTEKKITDREAIIAKESWKATQSMGEPFVHGSDWEYSFIQAQSASNDWLEAQRFGLTEAARWFGVPADLIDAAMSGDHVTYANVVQRNLQFLIMNLYPAIRRRENSLSNLLPRPRSIKLNEDGLLRMDPVTAAQVIETKIRSRTLAPSEARKYDNLPAFTIDQIEEFNVLGLNPRSSTPQTSLAPMTVDQAPVYAGVVPPTGLDGQPAVEKVPEPPAPATPIAQPNPADTNPKGKV